MVEDLGTPQRAEPDLASRGGTAGDQLVDWQTHAADGVDGPLPIVFARIDLEELDRVNESPYTLFAKRDCGQIKVGDRLGHAASGNDAPMGRQRGDPGSKIDG